MERYIFIIKCVSTINNITKVDNCFAVASEEEAKKEIERMSNSKNEEMIIGECKINYIYELIRLYD